ncbi:WecB/TagA/CpsF family glycosyltransferase [Kiritimatiella glycovorans]|nr:WecB/TagA/CpsF family glycosyltransferase [Kiritimatiella glycovorans]
MKPTQQSRPPRFDVLGVGVDAIDMSDALRVFEEAIERGGGHDYACALGVAGIMEARRNPEMRRILNASILNTPDGMPLVWLGKLHGYRNIRRVYGPDLLNEVCAYSAGRGWRHFFYGAAPGVADQLADEMRRRYPGIEIAGTYCPPFRELTEEEEEGLFARVREAGTDIFWVGISTPRQLYFMGKYRGRIPARIICPVGYAFDVHAGVKKDAPEWIKHSGFQWLHRALTDPRLWSRYLRDNPRFAVEALLQLCRLKKFPKD